MPFVGLGWRALSRASLPSRGREVRTVEAERVMGRVGDSSSGMGAGGVEAMMGEGRLR